MSEPFLGEIKIVSFGFAPRGWAFCNGQLLPINQNQALFALLGTTFGGDGRVNFALPNLQGRAPVHVGSGVILGESGGEENHVVTSGEMAAHTHQAQGNMNTATAPSPVNNFWAAQSGNPYSATANAAMSSSTTTAMGGGQTHNNIQPFLVLSFIIALQGIFPSRN